VKKYQSKEKDREKVSFEDMDPDREWFDSNYKSL
jgi:hypothetical protein